MRAGQSAGLDLVAASGDGPVPGYAGWAVWVPAALCWVLAVLRYGAPAAFYQECQQAGEDQRSDHYERDGPWGTVFSGSDTYTPLTGWKVVVGVSGGTFTIPDQAARVPPQQGRSA